MIYYINQLIKITPANSTPTVIRPLPVWIGSSQQCSVVQHFWLPGSNQDGSQNGNELLKDQPEESGQQGEVVIYRINESLSLLFLESKTIRGLKSQFCNFDLIFLMKNFCHFLFDQIIRDQLFCYFHLSRMSLPLTPCQDYLSLSFMNHVIFKLFGFSISYFKYLIE